MKNIIVLGDSHGSIYQDSFNLLYFYPLGPVTIYNLLKDDSHARLFLQGLERMDPKRDIPIIVLGEIDCRIHVYHQYKKRGKRLIGLIWDTAVKYMDAVNYLKDRGFQTGVHGIPPGSRELNIYGYSNYADLETHGIISADYNYILKNMAETLSIPFFDAYTGYCDEDGIISMECSEDGCHISPKTGIVQKFVEWVRKEVEGG